MTTASASGSERRRLTEPTPRRTDRPRAHTRVVDTATDLLELLPSGHDALAWVRGGEGMVGWGAVATFASAGPDRFERAAHWWREFSAGLDVCDEVGMPGTGPVAFVSMAFADEPGHSILVVPKVIVGRRNGVTWVTEFDQRRGSRPISGMYPVRPVAVPSTIRYSEGELSVTGYREAVSEAVRRLRAGQLRKVVLAHDLLARIPHEQGPVDPRYLLHALAGRNPDCWTFAVDGLVGATPELLLRRAGDEVSARVLAGTIWPRDGVPMATLAASLLDSAKNQEEHRYATESLVSTLGPFCAELDVAATPTVLPLRNVLHLATEVHGRLAEKSSLLTLAGAVHPTAAVGGTPTDVAVRLIAELERMDRGRYAGPVGWIDRTGDGEFGIALRCAALSGSTVRLFAGGGIVAGSDPDSEVLEANAKLVTMRDALESTG